MNSLYFLAMLIGQEPQPRIVPKTVIDRAAVEEVHEPMKIGKVELGKLLFHDPLLSSNGKAACSTCHIESKGWSSGRIPLGIDSKPLDRRAPSLFNVGDRKSYFVDGRAASLQAQAREVLLNPREMGNKTLQEVCDRIAERRGFKLSESQLIDALTAFEQTIRRDAGRFGKYLEGDPDINLLSAAERRGYELFRGKANCYQCHPPASGFTDERLHNTGSGGPFRAGDAGTFDVGRAAITDRREDIGKFRTPTLWGCKLSAPYFHAAQLKTLEEVVEFYNRGGHPNKYLDREMFPLRLSPDERKDLVAFLRSL